MGYKQSVQLIFPIKSKDFSASFSRVERLTGVQYLLLTMISSNHSNTITWQEIIGRFGIPEEIYERVFKRALSVMLNNRKTIVTAGNFSIQEFVSLTKLTPIGKEAYSKMVITQNEPEEFNNTVSFLPAKTIGNKYFRDSTVRQSLNLCNPGNLDSRRYSDVMPDDIKIENIIITKKNQFGIDDPEAQIFDLRIDSTVKESFYKQKVIFEYDSSTGMFSMVPGDMDETFVKSRFDSDDIISSMDTNSFLSKSKDFEFKEWNSEMPEWEQFSFMIPAEVDINSSRIVIVDPKSCKINSTNRKYRVSQEDINCDMVSIDSESRGFQYYFVNMDVKISGFDGSGNCNIILRRPINDIYIRNLVGKQISAIVLKTPSDLDDVLFLADVIKSKTVTSDILESYLRSSTNLDLAIKEIQPHVSKTSEPIISDIIESILSERKDISIDDSLSLLSSNRITIGGSSFAASRKTGDASKDVINADKIMSVSKNIEGVISAMDIAPRFAEIVLENQRDNFQSKPFTSAKNAYNNLTRLKNKLNVRSISDYSFDLDSLDDAGEKKEIADNASTFSKELSYLDKYLRSSTRYQEIKAYGFLFDDIAAFCRNNQPVDKAPPRNFGINLGIELVGYLKLITSSGTLDEMLKSALAEQKISDEDYRVLDDFREFRNECAHSATLPDFCRNTKEFEKKRRFWIDTVRRVKPSDIIPEKKK